MTTAVHSSGHMILNHPMKLGLSALYLLIVAVLLGLIFLRLPATRGATISKTRDMFHIYQDASLLAGGENPYHRISGKNLQSNEKYTFYLPGFLVAAAATLRIGNIDSYDQWMTVWIPISFVFHVVIGVLLYFYCLKRWGLPQAIIGSGIWWFARWPLALLRSGQIDNVAIFFFVLSLVFLERQRILSLITLGTSLAIKQMAAFTVPLYLGYVLYREKQSWKSLWPLFLVPVILSLPFFIWDPVSFFRMLLFPLTRDPVGPRSVEYFIGISGIVGKLPFLLFLILSYWICIKGRVPFFASLLLIMLLFLSFNAVFFSRYFCWAVPLIPLALFECFEKEGQEEQ